jgi:hypothetical protein
MISFRLKIRSVYVTFIIISCLIILIPGECYSQVLKDKASMDLIKRGITATYSLKFETADSVNKIISEEYIGHPVNNLLKALTIYWKNFPLLPSSSVRTEYEAELRKCIEICENKTDPGNEAEFILANLSARGLLLVFYSDNDLSKDVIPLASSTYKHLRQSFYHTAECTDLYYFTGLYNYYRDAYPKIYPVYRAVAFLFPPGDSQVGLTMLEKSAAGAFVLGQESSFMLYWIQMHYEHNYNKSFEYISDLRYRHPENDLYQMMYLKNLLLLKRYNEAEELVKNHDSSVKTPFFSACSLIFMGLIKEKKYFEADDARRYYEEGIEALKPFGAYGAEFMAHGYYGLSRIGEEQGNKEKKREYRRKANELADFKSINFDE